MSEDDALFELLGQLEARDYRFTTVTPETHARALARPRQAITIRDILAGTGRSRQPKSSQ